MANIVEPLDEFPPFRGRGDGLGSVLAHAWNDVDPRFAVCVQEAHAVDAIGFRIHRIVHEVLC